LTRARRGQRTDSLSSMARIDQFTKSKLAILGKQPAAVQADVFLRAFCGTFAVEKRRYRIVGWRPMRHRPASVAVVHAGADGCVWDGRSGVFEATLEHAAAFQAALRVNTARTGEQCHALEEDLAHQFLETHVHPLTVVEMRAAFRELDLDQTHQVRPPTSPSTPRWVSTHQAAVHMAASNVALLCLPRTEKKSSRDLLPSHASG
jgi:hypothetical protein